MCAFDDAVALHQIHALERNVQARVFGITQQHEFASTPIGFDLPKTFELADAVIYVHNKIAGPEFGKVREEAAGAHLAAGTFDGGRDIEKIGVAVQSELGFRECGALWKRRTNQDQGCVFAGTFRSESRSRFFGLAQDIRYFVFSADVGEAFQLSSAGGSEKYGAAGSELGLNFSEAGDHIAVEPGAGAGDQLEALRTGLREAELIQLKAGGLGESAPPVFHVPEKVGDFRRIGATVALVIYDGRFEEVRRGFVERLRLIEKYQGLERAFRQLEQRAGAGFFAAAEPTVGLPVFGLDATGNGRTPLGERKNRGFVDRRNGTLCAGIEFANGLDGIAKKLEAHRARRFGRENVHDASANSELAREFDHFGACVTSAGQV